MPSATTSSKPEKGLSIFCYLMKPVFPSLCSKPSQKTRILWSARSKHANTQNPRIAASRPTLPASLTGYLPNRNAACGKTAMQFMAYPFRERLAHVEVAQRRDRSEQDVSRHDGVHVFNLDSHVESRMIISEILTGVASKAISQRYRDTPHASASAKSPPPTWTSFLRLRLESGFFPRSPPCPNLSCTTANPPNWNSNPVNTGGVPAVDR